MNQKILDEITNQNYSVIKGRIQEKMQDRIIEIGSKGIIFGLSVGFTTVWHAFTTVRSSQKVVGISFGTNTASECETVICPLGL